MNHKEAVYNVIKTAIIQSTHNPEYVSVSSVKLSDVMGLDRETVETCIRELIGDGRLVQKKIEHAPMGDVLMLPDPS